ncbi:MAG TPA: TIGR00730 family Rossman fold protein [Anaerolineales bacterium]|nr:TIGR00730 family Rossman fold protein [Anaerolineales bacterium]
MKSICIFCGSADAVHEDYIEGARWMGRTLAERDIRLIYGGGKTGLMGVVADAVLEAGGIVVGVIIPSMNTTALAHVGLTQMDVVDGMHARKARMHELSDGYIAMPGGFGTFDELFETVTWAQTGAHEKPVGLFNIRNYYAPLLAAIDHAVAEGFIFPEHREVLFSDSDSNALIDKMAQYQHPREAVKRWMREE